MNKEKSPAIKVSELRKSFGDNEVIKGIDFEVAHGEVISLIGPSGSGKSTILRMLNRLEDPTSGKVVIEGTDITDPATNLNSVRQHIGMVFQHFNLFPNMTVIENIMLAKEEWKKKRYKDTRD